MRIAVLVSGVGSILEAIWGSGLDVGVVLADRPCRALEISQARGIRVALTDRRDFARGAGDFDRSAFSDAVSNRLQEAGVGVVALAGFGTVLAGRIHEDFGGRMVNTHPSLLPSFPGWHSVAQALEAGVHVTGTTAHVVGPQVDAGPILAQEPVRVRFGDTVESLHERIKIAERRLFPQVLAAAIACVGLGEEWWRSEEFWKLMQEVQG